MTARKSLLDIVALGLALVIACVAQVGGVEINSAAPAFRIKAGNDQELTLAMLPGKVITLFYETKDVVEKNRPLKTALKELYLAQPQGLQQDWARIPVIDCASAAWPITQIWQYKLKENSRKEGITIYGDWDGKVRSDYGLQPNESNVVIIDRAGRLRYRASGGIAPEEMQRIVDLVKTLLQER
jgi:predicted transcriptional regulator